MRPRALLSSVLVALALALPVGSAASPAQNPRPLRPRVQNAPQAARRAEQQRLRREENLIYVQAQRALDEARWREAAELLSRLAAMNGTRRDAAL